MAAAKCGLSLSKMGQLRRPIVLFALRQQQQEALLACNDWPDCKSVGDVREPSRLGSEAKARAERVNICQPGPATSRRPSRRAAGGTR